jgi:hypothetical protein
MIVFLSIASMNVAAQDMKARYEQADSFGARYDSLYDKKILSAGSVKASNSFRHFIRTEKGKEFFLIRADKGEQLPSFDREHLAGILKKSYGKENITARDLPFHDTGALG